MNAVELRGTPPGWTLPCRSLPLGLLALLGFATPFISVAGQVFPTEKFQALFRVDKTSRAFDDIAVKLRDSFRIAGVHVKAGGGVRVLLVKLSRSFEASRTEFKRVESFDAAAAPAK